MHADSMCDMFDIGTGKQCIQTGIVTIIRRYQLSAFYRSSGLFYTDI